MSHQERKRITLTNRLLFLLAMFGVFISILVGALNALPIFLMGFIITLTALYLFALVLSSRSQFSFGIYLMIIGGNISITATILMIGADSYAQLMYLMVAGLPYLICDSKLGNKRLYLSAVIIPLWLISVNYANSHIPIFELSEDVKVYIRLTFILMTTSFSTFVLYHFNRLSEKQLLTIENQAKVLEEKHNKLKQYNHMVSHDLKTPIANIEGFFSLLQLEIENPNEEIVECMDGIENGIKQANNTIHDVIKAVKDINFLESMSQVNVENVTISVLDNLSKIIKSKGAKVTYDFHLCTEIKFGEVDLKSIIQNLISNSLKYSHSDTVPEINISTYKQDDYSVIKVKDNGLGIDLKKDGKKLFDIYERIHTNKMEGTGIGLNMINKIAELRGGKIEVESDLGKGSTFFVFIPNKIFS